MPNAQTARELIVLRPREAARMLGVCERTLREWTREKRVPHKRMGRVVLYSLVELQRWLADCESRGE
jgi:excisionase family DNA binding protein